tara:strand:+ start:52 stop:321 length:270 start_codon:yes stop_codon:yes gene_type:complete
MNISKEKREKISEQILADLYSLAPEAKFTAHIARELARDEEFIKKLLLEMKGKNLVVEIKKNPQGKDYVRRSRWKLSSQTHQVYKEHQQ